MSDYLAWLRRDNPVLIQLEADYAALDLPFKHTAWKDHQHSGVDIANFRAEGAYLGQGGRDHEQQYIEMFKHVLSIDQDHYLDKLAEDDSFEAITYTMQRDLVHDKRYTVSRDLCDSIIELYFVKEALPLLYDKRPLRWLDIGAGYGRFAHRLNALFPDTNYITCIDAVAVSTFLCEFYMMYRNCNDHVEVLPLTRVGEIEPGDFDIACNIHSFSEQSEASINWWLDKLVQWQVPYLFLVPHDSRFVAINEDGTIGNFRPLLAQHGYELIYEKPKYPDGINGLYPEVTYYMYARLP